MTFIALINVVSLLLFPSGLCLCVRDLEERAY